MKHGICYIFGAGETSDMRFTFSPNDLVIAADGGFDYLRTHGLCADVVLGDFDSVSSQDLPSECLRFPKEKDDTDMMLAIKHGLSCGYRDFAIYGGLGGRLDHTLANIQSLTFLSRHDACGTLYHKDYAVRVITDGTLSFDAGHPANKAGRLCSVFSLSDVSSGLTIRGMKYELDHADLTSSFPLGVSNEFTGNKADIEIKKGTVAVLWYLSDLICQDQPI